MGYSWRQRHMIERKARAKVGLLKKQNHDDFIEECVTNLIDDGEAADESEAETMCEIIWDEENQGD